MSEPPCLTAAAAALVTPEPGAGEAGGIVVQSGGSGVARPGC
jgi:hypothetical protein